MGIARGPKIVTSGLVLALDAADRNSYDGNIVVYSVQCYSTYSVSLRSSNYTVQYSDDNSNWTTAFTGVMSNNSSCGIITGTGVNTSNLTAHKYWRYVEGSAVTLHHPRVSRIDFITPNGSVYNLITYTSDNCADSGTTAVGTVSKQFTPSTWRDLSGNSNKGTLTNGPTFSAGNMGSIVFDGTDDYVGCIGSLTVTAATFITWIRRNGSQVSFAGVFFTRGGQCITGLNFYYDTNKIGYHWAAGYWDFDSNLTIPDLTWCMVALSVTSTAGILYLCQSSGITTATNTNSHPSIVLDNIKLAQDDTVAQYGIYRFFKGNIAISQVYGRALSSNEITQNFNAQKGRFGL